MTLGLGLGLASQSLRLATQGHALAYGLAVHDLGLGVGFVPRGLVNVAAENTPHCTYTEISQTQIHECNQCLHYL